MDKFADGLIVVIWIYANLVIHDIWLNMTCIEHDIKLSIHSCECVIYSLDQFWDADLKWNNMTLCQRLD